MNRLPKAALLSYMYYYNFCSIIQREMQTTYLRHNCVPYPGPQSPWFDLAGPGIVGL